MICIRSQTGILRVRGIKMLGGKKMRSKTIKKIIAAAVVAAMGITSIVPAAPAQAAAKTKKLTVKTKKITLYKGAAAGYGSMKLKVTVKPKKAKVTYKINKKKIASVSKKGVVKAKKPGKAKITVKSGSKKVVVKVVVKKIKKKVTKVTAPKNVTVKVGAKQKIKTSVKPKKATLKKLTFKSSAKKIAKVNAKGVITGVKAGKAKITVKAVDGSKKKATVSVVVTAGAVATSPAITTGPAVTAKVAPSATVAPTTNTNAQTTTKKQPSQTTIKSSVNVGKAVVKKAIKKKSAKKISLTLKRVNGATKYKVQIAKDKKFKKTIVTKTTKKLTYSVSNSKFKKAKKLYARAKAIVVKGKKTYQGKWSKPKQVKIKK